MLMQHVHVGEAEAIVLAVEQKADYVLIDEQEGRRVATQANLNVIGVLGVLLRAKATGQIPLIRPEIDRLRNIASFFISTKLANQVLAAAGE